MIDKILEHAFQNQSMLNKELFTKTKLDFHMLPKSVKF